MLKNALDYEGLKYFYEKIKEYINDCISKISITGGIVVDEDLNKESTNAIQNKAVTNSIEDLNEKIFNITNFIEQKTDIFSCSYVNSTTAPTIEYTECYLDKKTGFLHMDIKITFDTAEDFCDITLTILDEECCLDVDNINNNYNLSLYEYESNNIYGTFASGLSTSTQLSFRGSNEMSLSYRVKGYYPTATIIDATIQDQINDLSTDIETINNTYVTKDELGNINIILDEINRTEV